MKTKNHDFFMKNFQNFLKSMIFDFFFYNRKYSLTTKTKIKSSKYVVTEYI